MSASAPSPQDRAEIDDLYNEYLWALDTGDSDAFVDTFFDDATILEDQPDGSTWRGSGHGDVRAFVRKYHDDPAFPGHQHRETTRVIRPDAQGRPDTWELRSYVFATRFDVETHSANLYWSGYYRDVVAKRDGEWRFVERWIAPWKGDVLSGFSGPRDV